MLTPFHYRKLIALFGIGTCLSLAACGSGSSSTTSTTDDDGGGTGGTVAQVTGQVAVSADDLALASTSARMSIAMRSSGKTTLGRPSFDTVGDTVLPDATVTVTKISGDGTEEIVDTTVTDENGEYTLADLPVATGGTGDATDFFYMVEVVSGDLSVKAPLAPTGDETVNISPESNVAASLLTNVAKVPNGLDALPTPTPEMIAELRDTVEHTTTELGDSIAFPSLLDGDGMNALASGVTTIQDNTEDLYKTVNFNAEFLAVQAEDSTAEQAASYIKHLVKSGCGDQASNPIPVIAATAMGQAMIDGTTFTPTDVVTAFNAVSDQDVVLEDSVGAFANALTNIDDTFAAALDEIAPFSEADRVPLYAKRDLTGADFSALTALDGDQAVTFLQSLAEAQDENTPCPLSTGVDVSEVIANLTDDESLIEPQVSEVEIYHDSGFGCNQGEGEGHFRANVQLYLPASAGPIASVTITSSDATALDGDGTVELDLEGGIYRSNEDGVCVTLDEEVTYTVNVTLEDDTELEPFTVTRTHPLVPEAQTFYAGEPMSGSQDNPTLVDALRPLITWTSPDETLAGIPSVPAGSRVVNTYEFSYLNLDDADGPMNNPACPTVSSARYDVDSFLLTEDCDPTACATAAGLEPDRVVCRMNIQTFLVDEYDNLLGQAAGEFSVFTPDLDQNEIADSEE